MQMQAENKNNRTPEMQYLTPCTNV